MITVKKSFKTEYGVVKLGTDYVFTVALPAKESVQIVLYDAKGKKLLDYDLDEYKLSGNVYSFSISGLNDSNGFQYEYIVDGLTLSDPYMKNKSLKREFSVEATEDDCNRAVINSKDYDFEDDTQLNLDFSEIISYQLHVRGFTKHSSSKVKGKGCFLGIIEKIPYLLELNINQIEIMPAYDFNEIEEVSEEIIGAPTSYPVNGLNSAFEDSSISKEKKINYWGYKKANYFCPKPEYAYSSDAVTEFKDMVKALHKAGIELIMQMYFETNTRSSVIIDSLRYWYLEYHVDGFHVMGGSLPIESIVTDDFLANAKIYINNIDRNNPVFSNESISNVAEINNDFLISARRFLKSDSDSISAFVSANRSNPSMPKKINYLSCYEGFTLYDTVSYEHKHNEANGENNSDGTDYNFSWNCGVEGKSSKKSVKELRLRQIKNALAMLFLSQSTPMLFMGDETMNTQNGNNNPYCQDNEITWINWKLNKSSEEILAFTKMLTSFRKNHPVVHQMGELKNMDYLRTGFPDISYHQDMAWKSSLNNYLLHIGVMLDGSYANINDKNLDDTMYIAYNMHWENHIFGLPRLKKGMKWTPVFASCNDEEYSEISNDLTFNQDEVCVYKRSIIVLKASKSALKED